MNTKKTNMKIGLSEKSMSDVIKEAIVEIKVAKKLVDILFEQELTDEEIAEFDNLTPDEEKVLRMRLGITESLKGSLDNNVYEKEGQG